MADEDPQNVFSHPPLTQPDRARAMDTERCIGQDSHAACSPGEEDGALEAQTPPLVGEHVT